MKHAALLLLPLVPSLALAALATLSLAAQHGGEGAPPVGYSDTPFLPDGKWRVHDVARPAPAVVNPGPAPAAPAPVPEDAVVLFDGKDLSRWTSGGKEARWKVAEGAMEVNGTGTIETRESFGDLQLHLEWAAPKGVESASQGRGNSGVFFMGRYELQVLDSFENRTYSDGQAAALYGQTPPLVNACRKPGEWQSYDVVFTAPRFENGGLKSPARITVFHNGVLVHHDVAFLGATAHRAVAQYAEHAASGPIALQDHGNPVRYRNVWVRKL
jgi:hypothetical protein